MRNVKENTDRTVKQRKKMRIQRKKKKKKTAPHTLDIQCKNTTPIIIPGK